jgi:uncharacterized protein YjbJ (UPF0337 family)
MGDRMDEAKGDIKEGAGKLTGNERLEREGAAESDAAEARRETRGAAQEVGGKVKEGLGKLTGDESTEAEGKADQLRGKANRAG